MINKNHLLFTSFFFSLFFIPTVLADSGYHYFSFDEGSGNAIDSGNTTKLSYIIHNNNYVADFDNSSSGAIRCYNSDDSILTLNNTGISFNRPKHNGTLSFKVKGYNYLDRGEMLGSYNNGGVGGTDGFVWHFSFSDAGDNPNTIMLDSNSWRGTSFNLTNGTWRHLIWTWAGDENYIYADKTAVSHFVLTDNISNSNMSICTTGYSIASSHTFDGLITNVFFTQDFSVMNETTLIEELYNCGYTDCNVTGPTVSINIISPVNNTNTSNTTIEIKTQVTASGTPIFYIIRDNGTEIDNITSSSKSYNYTNSSLIDGTHNFNITVYTNDSIIDTGFLTLNIDRTAPYGVTLISPDNSTHNNILKPSFNWTNAEDGFIGFDKYQFELSNFTDFSTLEFVIDLTVSNYTFINNLSDGDYYWRIRYNDTLNNTNITGYYNFTIDTINPVITFSNNPKDDNTSIIINSLRCDFVVSDDNLYRLNITIFNVTDEPLINIFYPDLNTSLFNCSSYGLIDLSILSNNTNYTLLIEVTDDHTYGSKRGLKAYINKSLITFNNSKFSKDILIGYYDNGEINILTDNIINNFNVSLTSIETNKGEIKYNLSFNKSKLNKDYNFGFFIDKEDVVKLGNSHYIWKDYYFDFDDLSETGFKVDVFESGTYYIIYSNTKYCNTSKYYNSSNGICIFDPVAGGLNNASALTNFTYLNIPFVTVNESEINQSFNAVVTLLLGIGKIFNALENILQGLAYIIIIVSVILLIFDVFMNSSNFIKSIFNKFKGGNDE